MVLRGTSSKLFSIGPIRTVRFSVVGEGVTAAVGFMGCLKGFAKASVMREIAQLSGIRACCPPRRQRTRNGNEHDDESDERSTGHSEDLFATGKGAKQTNPIEVSFKKHKRNAAPKRTIQLLNDA